MQFSLLVSWFDKVTHASWKYEPPVVPGLAFGNGGLAQLVERLLCKQNVNGSNPLTSTNAAAAQFEISNLKFEIAGCKPAKGPVAQLVRAPP